MPTGPNPRRFALLLVALCGAFMVLAAIWLRQAHLSRLPPNGTAPASASLPGKAPEVHEPAPPTTTSPASQPAINSDADSEASLNQWLAVLRNPAASPAELQDALQALATSDSPAAFLVLKNALMQTNTLRAAIAESLGASPNPGAVALLQSLAADADETVALAAIRALGAQATPEAIQSLSQILAGKDDSLNRRCEAAASLAAAESPEALNLASRALLTSTEEAIITQLLKGLGRRPIDETKTLFQNYLAAPNISPELKATALEALSQAQGDPAPVLLNSLQDASPQIRAAAAWAMSDTLAEGAAGAQLAGALQTETDPEVRRRIYQALGNQESYDLGTIESAIQIETDLSARLAGWNLLALTLQTRAPEGLAAYFDQYCLANLKALVLNAPTPEARQRAIACLKLANTPSAQAILSVLPAAPAKKSP